MTNGSFPVAMDLASPYFPCVTTSPIVLMVLMRMQSIVQHVVAETQNFVAKVDNVFIRIMNVTKSLIVLIGRMSRKKTARRVNTANVNLKRSKFCIVLV